LVGFLGLAQAVQTASSVTAASLRADFDNDGFDDLAVGISPEDVGASSMPGRSTCSAGRLAG
jgi:hypothetical protein